MLPPSTYANNSTVRISNEQFKDRITELNEQYEDEPVSNRLIVKSKYDINELDSVDIVEGYKDLHIVQFDNSESAEEALEYYNDSKLIEYAEQDFTMSTCEIDYKPHLSWGSESMGTDDYYVYLEDMEELPEVVVGIIDSGIELEHDYLKDRIIQTGVNFSDSGDKDSENDDHGHGTHCAGIIVDNTPDNVKIEGFKVLSAQGLGTITSVISGIYSAIEHNVNVISMSLGAPGKSYAMQEAVDLAISNEITVCAAAGNDGKDASGFCPANLDGVITVGAHDSYDKIPKWSNYGEKVDIIAPGVAINSTYIGNTYKSLSGTSMACPHVAAACALLLTKNINRTPSELLDIIWASARDLEVAPSRIEDKDKLALYIGVTRDPLARTPAPVFVTEDNIYEDYVDVEIRCEDENAQIYYTTDGSLPKPEESEQYTSPIHLTKSTRIVASAVSENKLKSKTVVADYTVISEEDESEFEIDENGIVTKYKGDNWWMKMPELINNQIVKGIGDDVFSNKPLYYLSIPKSVKTLGDNTFDSCENLVSIDLKNVESVGEWCFNNCVKLESVNFNKDFSVKAGSFADCNLLLDIDLTKLKNTSEQAFYDCYNIHSLINDKLTTIETSAFDACTSMIYVDIPNVTELKDFAFHINGQLETINAPLVEKIGESAFSSCEKLNSLIFPNLKQITGSNNFNGCLNVTTVDVHNIESDIPQGAFASMYELSEISLDKPVNIGNLAFSWCTKLRKIKLKNAVTIGERAFEHCENCTIYLPKAESIGQYSFFGTKNIKTLFAPKLKKAVDLPLSYSNTKIYLSENLNSSYISRDQKQNATIIAPEGSVAEDFCVTGINHSSYENNLLFVNSDSMVTAKGASIRTIDNGLRFGFSWNEVQELIEIADEVEYSFEYAYGETDVLNKTKKANNYVYHPEDNYTTFNLVFTGVPKSSFDTIISARAYVNIDGMTFKSPILHRSFSGVANAALNDNTLDEGIKEQIRQALEA